EAFLRLCLFPGEQAQADWAHFGEVRVGRARRRLSCFLITLSYSRALYLEFFFDQTMENFLRGHVHAFQAWSGTPRITLYDNLKSVVLERRGDAILFNPRLLELCGHYHFLARPCQVRAGNQKGRIERAIRYVRESFWAARTFRLTSPYLGWDGRTGLPPSFLRPGSTGAGPDSPAGTAAGKAQGPRLDSGWTLGTGGAGKRGLARGGFRPRGIDPQPNRTTSETAGHLRARRVARSHP